MRAAVVVIDGASVALIERVREGRRYYLFPGGGVGPGETPEDGARREAAEELGLEVELVRLVATATFDGEEQRYYLARAVGGRFGTGRGDEMTGEPIGQAGSYRALRWPISRLSEIDVRPAELSAIVQRVPRAGWPAAVTELVT